MGRNCQGLRIDPLRMNEQYILIRFNLKKFILNFHKLKNICVSIDNSIDIKKYISSTIEKVKNIVYR